MVHGTIPRGVSVARGGWAYWGSFLEGWGPLEFFDAYRIHSSMHIAILVKFCMQIEIIGVCN